jgi:hypothetical protein
MREPKEGRKEIMSFLENIAFLRRQDRHEIIRYRQKVQIYFLD